MGGIILIFSIVLINEVNENAVRCRKMIELLKKGFDGCVDYRFLFVYLHGLIYNMYEK